MTGVLSILDDLELRAGASDQDREAWLAERVGGITATEIRDLYMRKTTVQQLIDLKLGRRMDSFTGNKYTAWGNTREPVIAAAVALAYGISPESRVFHAADNPRFLASPDGVGFVDGQLVVDEIKTGKHDMRLGTVRYEQSGYHVQKTWSMRVTGARRALYVFEQHDDDWQDRGGVWPEPAPLDPFPYEAWVEYDEPLAKKLEVLAVGFLVALDAARAGEGPEKVIDEELDTLAVNYLRGLDFEKQGKALKEPAYRQMFELLDAGEPVMQESALARVSFSPAVVEDKPVFELDQVAAKAAAPAGLYERLEQAQHDVEQAQEALGREQMLVDAHEAGFVVQSGVERFVTKKAALRVTATKETKK